MNNFMTDRAIKKQGSYFQFLDALRGIAILLVIIHHVGLHFSTLIGDAVAGFLISIGWSGVDVFFAISGYLITKILLNSHGASDIKIFFIKRVFRIIPLCFAAVIFYLFFGYIVGEKNISMLWLSALFLTGWVIPFFGAEAVPYTITWSLSVEESAYIFFGLVAVLGRTSFSIILIGLIIMSLILRWVLVDTHLFQVQEVYYFPLTRIDSIAFGGLVAMNIIRSNRSILLGSLSCIFVIALYFWLSKAGQYNRNVAVFGYTALAFSSALVVSYAITVENSTNVFIRLFTHIGKRSYFIYLFHVFVIGAVGLSVFSELRTMIGFWGVVGVVLAITMIMAEFSWRYFEYPLIQFGRKLARSI